MSFQRGCENENTPYFLFETLRYISKYFQLSTLPGNHLGMGGYLLKWVVIIHSEDKSSFYRPHYLFYQKYQSMTSHSHTCTVLPLILM